jgi:hypothetical protein
MNVLLAYCFSRLTQTAKEMRVAKTFAARELEELGLLKEAVLAVRHASCIATQKQRALVTCVTVRSFRKEN